MDRPPDKRKSGPHHHVEAASKTKATAVGSTVDRPADGLTADEVAACRRWAYRYLRRVPTPGPRFGSAAFNRLADGPVKVASVMAAALSTLQCDAELAIDLERELDARRRHEKALDDADYVARADAHRRSAPRYARSFAERRREQLAAAGLDLHDHPGLVDHHGRGA